MQSPSPRGDDRSFREESANRLKVQPASHRRPEPLEVSVTNTWGLTAPEMEMTHTSGVIVSYAIGGSQSTPSDLGPNRENYQIHTACF